MRWIFLLLVVLNAFYYVWHQQQAPLRPKEVAPLAQQQNTKRDIHLLSETDNQQRRTPVIEPPTDDTCMYLGSFEQRSEAQVVEQRLISLDINSEVRSVDDQAGVDYWVYIPPLGSRSASLRQLKELQARNIDSYLISQGDLENGISLGIFPRKDSAQSVIQRLEDVGYASSLRELPRAHRSYWVRIAPESRRLADDSLLEKLAFDFNGLKHQLMPCESIASSQ
ncbi:SPOR domain-containing protein [Pseudomonas sp. NPDC078700]|uniref:SPOR domain-containing protein n=1 Tax=Pseudomonas sp. NPDC078700 TaxID=3364424 RepID=UPI0037CB9CC3